LALKTYQSINQLYFFKGNQKVYVVFVLKLI